MDISGHSCIESLRSWLAVKATVKLGYWISLAGFLMYFILVVHALQEANSRGRDVFLVLCLSMAIGSVLLLVGLLEKQVKFFYPWLITSPVTVVLGLICVLFFSHFSQVVLSLIVLLFTTLAWYPIFCIFKKYRPSIEPPEPPLAVGTRESHPLNIEEIYQSSAPPADTITVTVVPHVTATEANYTGDPPSYFEVFGSNIPYPYGIPTK